MNHRESGKAADKESGKAADILKSGLVLLIVTAVAGMCLGFVYELTREPIQYQLELALYESMGAVLPQADTYYEVEDFEPTSALFNLTRGEAGGSVVGYIIGASRSGYSGRIDVLVGLDTEGTIQGINILNHSETPGLGANATRPDFTDQFKGNYERVSTTRATPSQNEIVVITASTITTDAIVQAVNEALGFFEANLR